MDFCFIARSLPSVKQVSAGALLLCVNSEDLASQDLRLDLRLSIAETVTYTMACESEDDNAGPGYGIVMLISLC